MRDYRAIGGRRALERVLRSGKAVSTSYFRMHYLEGGGPPGLAFLAGRSVGGAVKRNRAKRVLREAFRTSVGELSGIEALVFVATSRAATAQYVDVRDVLEAAIRRISDTAGSRGN
jgi:ribonuclease P protein component